MQDDVSRRGAISAIMAATVAPNIDSAQLAAQSALGASNFFGTAQFGSSAAAIAAGEAATPIGGIFSIDDGEGNLIHLARIDGGSSEIARTLTPSALAADDGASRIGSKRTPTAALLHLDELLDLDFVRPEQFRLAEHADDTAAMIAAIDYARTAGKAIQLTGGREYIIDGPLDFQNVIKLTSQGLNAVLKAKPGSRDGSNTAFVRFRDMARSTWDGIRIDANGEFDIGLDTSYNASIGPSLNTLFKNIQITGFLKVGWLADNNNDVWNENILIFEPGSTAVFSGSITGNVLNVTNIKSGKLSIGQLLTTYGTKIVGQGTGRGGTGTYLLAEAFPSSTQLPNSSACNPVISYKANAIGGPVHFSNSNLLAGPAHISAQWINFVSTVVRGVVIGGNGSWNNFSSSGGHFFPDPETGIVFAIEGECWGFTLIGAHIENNMSGGAIIGGAGKLVAPQLNFFGCHIFRSAESSPDIKTQLGRAGLEVFGTDSGAIFRMVGGVIENLALDLPWGVLDAPGANVNGSLATEHQRFTIANPTRSARLDPSGVQASVTGGSWGSSSFIAAASRTENDGWAALTGVPGGTRSCSIIVIAPGSPDAPSAIFALTAHGDGGSRATAITKHDGATGPFAGATVNVRFNDGIWEMQMADGPPGIYWWTATVLNAQG